MDWEAMELDEYAAFRRTGGSRVEKVKGRWWVEARPFFFLPLFPFTAVPPFRQNYPRTAALGGVLHPVPEGAPANCRMNFFVYDDLEGYALKTIGKKERWAVTRGIAVFCAARITDPARFVKEAFPVYRSFYDRTRYFYLAERRERDGFAKWARTLFCNRKNVVTGIYRDDRLCAVHVSHRVEDVVIADVFFADTESLKLRVTDFAVHQLRESARTSGAGMIFMGYPSGKETLDFSKVSRGCKTVTLPAHRRINPIALCVGKAVMKQSYRKLAAMTA